MSGNKDADAAAVEAYLAGLAPEVRERTEQLRDTMLAAVGEGAGARISYNIILITQGERHILFCAGWAKHVAIYPTPRDTPWEDQLAPLRSGKDSLQLKHSRELPLQLVTDITRWVVDHPWE